MLVIKTENLVEGQLDQEENYWTYNGLDSCLTMEIFQEIIQNQTENSKLVYDFERALQAPALEMMLRGVRIDMEERAKVQAELDSQYRRMLDLLNTYAEALWGKPLNPNSPKQLQAFFYDFMKLPPVMARRPNGSRGPTTNREALEKLQAYLYARPFCLIILAAREVKKRLDVVTAGVDKDCRMRTSYNVAGTITGRWSSSENAFGTGTNLQNITDSMRKMFVADPGMKLGYLDGEQAEARLLGLLCYIILHAETYLNACESGDLHTTVCQLVWPNLAWTDDPSHNKKKIAGEIFYRHFTYRDMAKRGGHGTNYYGQPFTMAKHLKVDQSLMESFQNRYFKAFPEIPDYHQWVAQQIMTKSQLTTPLGRHRTFFGRTNDDATLREAIAHIPQSTLADLLDLGLYMVWKLSLRLNEKYGRPVLQLLGQIHDAILIQYDEALEGEILFACKKEMEIPLSSTDCALTMGLKPPPVERKLIIPIEAQVGWNWSHYVKDDPHGLPDNLDGIKVWYGTDERTRQGVLSNDILGRVCA